MGEAKDREAAIKAAQEEEAKRQEELQKLLATPLTEADAKKALADIEVRRAQIVVIRQKWIAKQNAYRSGIAEAQTGIDECDSELAGLALEQNIVFRRTLNPQPAMGQPVGGKKA